MVANKLVELIGGPEDGSLLKLDEDKVAFLVYKDLWPGYEILYIEDLSWSNNPDADHRYFTYSGIFKIDQES